MKDPKKKASHMSSYVKRSMQDDEEVLHTAQLHWIIYNMGVALVVLGGIVGQFMPSVAVDFLGEEYGSYLLEPIKWASIFIIGLGFLQLINAFVRQISTELVITDQRVIAKHGLISCTSYELMMTKVEGATIDQSILGRLFGFGTLMVKGTGGGISPIDHVAKPFFFHAALMDALQAVEDKASKSA